MDLLFSENAQLHFTTRDSLNLYHVTRNTQILILAILRYGGQIGNNIFFVCSAWFLVGKKSNFGKKIFRLWFQVWVVSVIILVGVLLFGNVHLGGLMIMTNLLPTIFNNNWYVSCYLLFLMIVPLLNVILENISKKQLLSINMVTAAMWIIEMVFIDVAQPPFYMNNLLFWCALFFDIAYLKKYFTICRKNTTGIILLIIGVAGHIGIILLTNTLGQHISFLENGLIRWCSNKNIFIIFIAVGALLFTQRLKFKSSFINTLSSLSLLIYISHSNLLLRKFYRPQIFEWLWHSYGYDSILLWILVFSIGIFTLSAIVSFAFQKTIGQLVNRMSGMIYLKLKMICVKVLYYTEIALNIIMK